MSLQEMEIFEGIIIGCGKVSEYITSYLNSLCPQSLELKRQGLEWQVANGVHANLAG